MLVVTGQHPPSSARSHFPIPSPLLQQFLHANELFLRNHRFVKSGEELVAELDDSGIKRVSEHPVERTASERLPSERSVPRSADVELLVRDHSYPIDRDTFEHQLPDSAKLWEEFGVWNHLVVLEVADVAHRWEMMHSAPDRFVRDLEFVRIIGDSRHRNKLEQIKSSRLAGTESRVSASTIAENR